MHFEETRGWPKRRLWPLIFLGIALLVGFPGHSYWKSHDDPPKTIAANAVTASKPNDPGQSPTKSDPLVHWLAEHGILTWLHHHGLGPSIPPPTNADALFLDTLEGNIWGIAGSRSDRTDLIAQGHEICNALESGLSRQSVHDQLVIKRSNTSDSDASWLITASVGAYCPRAA